MVSIRHIESVVYSSTETARKYQLTKIDSTTAKLIAKGYFVYADKYFSMSTAAQFNTLTMYTRRNDSTFMYPVIRSTQDSSDSVELINASNVEAFYTACESAVRELLDAGNALKSQVNALSTLEQVKAFVDPRS